ncbi:hypothetical protein BDW75DRAFT_199495 [Aspergillus navahoensis]
MDLIRLSLVSQSLCHVSPSDGVGLLISRQLEASAITGSLSSAERSNPKKLTTAKCVTRCRPVILPASPTYDPLRLRFCHSLVAGACLQTCRANGSTSRGGSTRGHCGQAESGRRRQKVLTASTGVPAQSKVLTSNSPAHPYPTLISKQGACAPALLCAQQRSHSA